MITRKHKSKIDELEVGNLVYYFDVSDDFLVKPKVGIVIKVKKLLKLYDVLLQAENRCIKNIHISKLQKVI